MKKFCSSHKLFIALLLVLISAGIIYATTFKYAYLADAPYLETNLYGGAAPDLAADEAYDLGADIDLETAGYYGMWITLEHDSVGTTDDIIIGYFGSYDGTNYDDVALFEITCDASSGANLQQSWGVFPAPPHGKIGVKTSDTNDTFDYQITLHKVYGDGT